MDKDIKISIKPKLLQALHGDVTPTLEKKLNAIAAQSEQTLAASETHSSESKNQKYKPRKKAISIRLDMDVLAWFKAQPGKYQKTINKACRAYMNSVKQEQADTV